MPTQARSPFFNGLLQKNRPKWNTASRSNANEVSSALSPSGAAKYPLGSNDNRHTGDPSCPGIIETQLVSA